MMANLDEDVIELGSSDEEREPAPKKKRIIPKAMVHIPTKLSGVTIKPSTSSNTKINPASIAKAIIGKAITVTKVTSGNNRKLSNPFANKNILNGSAPVRKPTIQIPIAVNKPTVKPGMTVMPTFKKLRQIPADKSPITIIKAPTLRRPLPTGTLPPGITVKRTSQMQSVLKQNMKPNHVNRQVKIKVRNSLLKKATGENNTVVVDLDEDDAAPCPGGPQWYLRPEEQNKKAVISTKSEVNSMDVEQNTSETTDINKKNDSTGAEKGAPDLEKQNNKEPDTSKFIEITIEDSPAKPQPKSKRTCEVSELAITIDDSPIKGASNKPASPSGSDEETTSSKEKHSKKKLEYPKTAKVPETVEIEIELNPIEDVHNDDDIDSQNSVESEIVEIVESPSKPTESFHASTPKKKIQQKPQSRMNDKISVGFPKRKFKLDTSGTTSAQKIHHYIQSKLNKVKAVSTPEEFHPVYQRFIDLCFRLEDSEDMSKIVEKKIKAYYRQVPKEYTESEMFTDMVSSKINAMKAGPEKMYLYIKDVVDELNLQRKMAKAQPVKVVTDSEEQDKFLYGEDSEFDSKRQRQIRKLEKTLKKLHRAIQKLEEQEVDFDDEEDSVYLLTESEEDTSMDDQPLEKSALLKRYKERMIRVHAKFCQLTNTKMPSEPRVLIEGRPGQPKGPAKRLEKWINKKVPIGTPLPFPDFHDVIRCVRDANQEEKLGWNEVDILEEARDLFTRCGKKLQRRRQENEWRLAASRIQSEIDPAEESEVLKKALDDNRRVSSKKESELLNKFADKQNQLNLEAVEIGDKEADESPVETDDEEPTEETTSLQTKEKRKERLKRLLQKTSKKNDEKKELPDIETKDNESKLEKGKETENKKVKSKDKSQVETANKEKDSPSDKQNDMRKKEEKKDPKDDSEDIHTLSDDSSKIDSDIDELHLLQKLHSNKVDSSTIESSDSESAIAISDTLSSGDNRKQASDVISIENSSYSESENNSEVGYEIVSYSLKKIVKDIDNVQIEMECSDAGVEKIVNKSNNDEYSESVEDILLASSDDEASKDSQTKGDPVSINATNKKQSKEQNIQSKTKESSKENVDNTDANLMGGIELTVDKNIIESSEVTSITSTASGDDDITDAVGVTGLNSVQTVGGDTAKNPIEKNAESDVRVVTCVKPAETVKDTDNKSTEKDKDIAMTSNTVNNKISDEINNVRSGIEDEITETVKDTGNNSTVKDKDIAMTNLTVNNKISDEVNNVTSGIENEITETVKDTGNDSTVKDKDIAMTSLTVNNKISDEVNNVTSGKENEITESVKDTANKSTEKDKDIAMTSLTVNNKISDEVNNVTSGKENEITESVKDTANKSTEKDKDIAMTSLTVNNKISDEVNDVTSGTENKITSKEVTDSKLTVSVEDIPHKHDEGTPAAENDGENARSDNTEDVTDVNVKGFFGEGSNDLPVPEPMEIDNDNT